MTCTHIRRPIDLGKTFKVLPQQDSMTEIALLLYSGTSAIPYWLNLNKINGKNITY